MTNKEFAEKNAGKLYIYDGEVVKVVGYWKCHESAVLLEVAKTGWGGRHLDEDDVFTHKVYFKRFKRFTYAYVGDLKKNKCAI